MATLKKMRTFDYNDVNLIPKRCIVQSRSEIDVSTQLGPYRFNVPVTPSNMSSVIDEELAISLAKKGYFYVMHRFDNDPIAFIEKAKEHKVYSSISVGVQKADYDNINKIIATGTAPDYITIDIAHGHADSVIAMIGHIKTHMPSVYVIAGNVGNVTGAIALERAGANAIKVGIGPGAACTTFHNTGFGTRGWQLSEIQEISEALTTAALIADGGIRTTGDIAKSIAFGADMVMIGGMFAGHDENPGEVIKDEHGDLKKAFYGSASAHQKGDNKNVEGISMLVPYKGSIWDTYKTIKENLQSSVSYAGGKELTDLTNVEYVIVGS